MIRLVTVLGIVLAPIGSPMAGELRPCFTPGEECTSLIVRKINSAREEILVQAYESTSPPIMRALAKAWEDRGVNVRVILDRINDRKYYTGATYLANHGIDVLIDDKVKIAHNKVMVIDGHDVDHPQLQFYAVRATAECRERAAGHRQCGPCEGLRRQLEPAGKNCERVRSAGCLGCKPKLVQVLARVFQRQLLKL
jgi:hypothetical protein